MKNFIAISSVLLVSACATYAPSVPKDYAGPTALLEDSAVPGEGTRLDFFVVTELDGKTIDNSMNETIRQTRGRGVTFAMQPQYISREVPSGKPITVTLLGVTRYTAPITEMINKTYEVSGKVTFTPTQDAKYVVRGNLSESGVAVWIEDRASSRVQERKIEGGQK